MTTPDTSTVRAWARDNGYDVADRGRLRPEVLDAYNKAQRKGATATKKAPAAKPAKKAASSRATPATKAPATKAPAAKPEPPKEASAPAKAPEPQPQPKPVTDDRRLVALGGELAALTERVAQLEAQVNGKSGKSSNGKTPRFRRSK